MFSLSLNFKKVEKRNFYICVQLIYSMIKKKIINGMQYSVVAVIFKADKILMFKREGEKWETGWEFVKGAIHFGETDEQAVLREINEEAGVKVKLLKKIPKVFFGEKPHKNGLLKIHSIVYSCKYLSGSVKLGEPEHVSYKWMNYEEAKKKIWLKQGKDAIERAIKIYESFK